MLFAEVHLQPVAALAALDSPFTLFEPAFARRALLATLCVALIGGMLGTSIVLRDLPFFTHAVGAGAYPVVVVGAGWGMSLAVAAQLGALAFAGCLWLLTLGGGSDPRIRDTRTGLLVAAALAGGAVLTTIFAHHGTRIFLTPEALLFGSVLTVDDLTLTYAAAMVVVSALLVYALGDRWLAAGFDRGAAPSLKVTGHDAALLLVVALAVAATLPLTGALMAGALLVVPAATARMFSQRAGALTLASLAIAVGEGLVGLYLALAFDLPAGATIAAVAGTGFVICALALWLRSIAA
ncbi:MAG: metal ABC transporter permease, partial [Thermoleophilia bacterium]|nr:metal ABC transporter permease [Thermoleophilia bacterium]